MPREAFASWGFFFAYEHDIGTAVTGGRDSAEGHGA